MTKETPNYQAQALQGMLSESLSREIQMRSIIAEQADMIKTMQAKIDALEPKPDDGEVNA